MFSLLLRSVRFPTEKEKDICTTTGVQESKGTFGFSKWIQICRGIMFGYRYYLGKEDSNIIDLGLSLRALQPETCPENYEVLLDRNQPHPQLKRTNSLHLRNVKENCEEESEGIQSKQRWSYVKVNMDGVLVGRKVCILDHMDYSSLALQLEDMFGNQSMSGLRLFQDESPFSLFYKDKDEQWRTVGDVPWKEFVDR